MRLFLIICMIYTFDANAQVFNAEKTESISLNSAYMSYSFQGAVAESGGAQVGTNATNIAIEWAHYFRKDAASVVGYRVARDENERTRYQAGMAGMRVYPWSTGVPIRTFKNLSNISYDFDWKPYFDGMVTAGRYLVIPQFKSDVADISAEFWGVMFGSGVTYKLTESNNLDMRFSYESVFGYGPLDFKAQTMFVTLGWGYYL